MAQRSVLSDQGQSLWFVSIETEDFGNLVRIGVSLTKGSETRAMSTDEAYALSEAIRDAAREIERRCRPSRRK